jgi:hypothetical protein
VKGKSHELEAEAKLLKQEASCCTDKAEQAVIKSQLSAILEHLGELKAATADADPLNKLLRATDLAEARRQLEDVAAKGLVDAYCTTLGADSKLGFLGAFDPPHDGDCLVRCAFEHDFAALCADGPVGSGEVCISVNGLRAAVVERVRATQTSPLEADIDSLEERVGLGLVRSDKARAKADAQLASLRSQVAKVVLFYFANRDFTKRDISFSNVAPLPPRYHNQHHHSQPPFAGWRAV